MTPKGVLGYYDPEGNQIAVSRDILIDFTADEALYKTIFVHEKIHQKGIMDEGLTQKLTAKRVSAVRGIYEKEQQDAQETFHSIGIEKAFELYEREYPARLAGYFTDRETERLWKEKWQTDFQKKNDGKRDDLLKEYCRRITEEIESALLLGAPRLFERLPDGYISQRVSDRLEKLL